MRAGRLDRRIELQYYVDSEDGDPTGGGWYTEYTVYAEQMDRASAERFVDGQTLAEAQQTYRIRYRSDIDPTWRVKDGEDFWTLTGAFEGDGRREETILTCNRFDPNEREFL